MDNIKTVIVSIAAKNIHKSLAAWCLKGYCEDKGINSIEIIETNININVSEIIGRIYQARPDVVAFSCYIWNIEYVGKIGGLIKKLLPGSVVILGGPEVSFEKDLTNFPFADYIITGAGEEAFYNLLTALKCGETPQGKIIGGCIRDFNAYPTPFTEEYFNSFSNCRLSIANQLVYYESSRGCPFSCYYCLSSAQKGVQYLDLDRIRSELLLLVRRGARCIKFADRTFNADKKRAKQILEFILNLETDCTFHFEAAADLFDEELLILIEKMPLCRVQFEIGIQSVNEQTLNAINRKTDISLALKNIQKLVSFKNCHIHVDLIAGLPYETISSFTAAINQCLRSSPHMLQLGFLKMLKGTKTRGDYESFTAVFSDFPPYEVYQTQSLSYEDILKLKKIESVVDKFYNSGAFNSTVEYAVIKLFESPYSFFQLLADYCPDALNLKISMKNIYTLLFNFLLQYGERKEIEHHIKLDCLSLDSKGLIPDSIKTRRNKEAEAVYRKQVNDSAVNIRIEFFEFDNTYKLFNYDRKNPLTQRFDVNDILV